MYLKQLLDHSFMSHICNTYLYVEAKIKYYNVKRSTYINRYTFFSQ